MTTIKKGEERLHSTRKRNLFLSVDGSSLARLTSIHPSSTHAQSLIARWKDTLIGRLDKINEENDQLVFGYLERMFQTTLSKADIVMNNLSRESNLPDMGQVSENIKVGN
ncbi:10253_t:CDS:2 [Paraglomus brasilianum]|uniref:10253_t:CDS:1 n=1 Tax=Paraglomus brasilianum TaxID=144538 RepID=A0A9N8WFB1_9GLOM|nr:10253_t:CDS:2 [Paraglomus brasilianum]